MTRTKRWLLTVVVTCTLARSAAAEEGPPPSYRNPGLAAAMSLNPTPIDFGNLYAKNVGWAVAYSGAELAIATPAVWIAAEHACGAPSCRDWSDGHGAAVVGLTAAYLVIKLVSGIHAAAASDDYNARQLRAASGFTIGVGSIGLRASF